MTVFAAGQQMYEGDQPNVILIMTDDQDYGDISSHGHLYLITPNMDRLREMSARLENFHVDPTCSPSRAALMTGRYSGRVGVGQTPDHWGNDYFEETRPHVPERYRALYDDVDEPEAGESVLLIGGSSQDNLFQSENLEEELDLTSQEAVQNGCKLFGSKVSK